MSKIHVKLIAAAAGLALSSASVLAAPILPGFTFASSSFFINPSAILGETQTQFTAGSITFDYSSLVNQFGGTGSGANATANFNQTGIARFASFFTGVGGTPIGASTTGLNLSTSGSGQLPGYTLYGQFTGTGTITTAGASPGSADGLYNSFDVTLFVDPNNDTTFTTSGTVAVQGTPDIPVLTGKLNIGGFNIAAGLVNGNFDVVFNVTGLGIVPFFTTTVSGAKITTGDLTGVITEIGSNVVLPPGSFTNGSLIGSGNVRLAATAIPEPGSIALMGLALAGLGFARRKTTAAQQAV